MKRFLSMYRRDYKNPANIVTTARLLLALALPYFILSKKHRRWAPVIFAVAASTDKLDGHLAKNVYGVTETGKILDPAVDKALAAFTLVPSFIMTIRKNNIPLALAQGLMLTFLIIREHSVLRLKMRAERATGRVDSAIQSGRVPMVAQSVAYGVLLLPIEDRRMDVAKVGILSIAAAFSAAAWKEYYDLYGAL